MLSFLTPVISRLGQPLSSQSLCMQVAVTSINPDSCGANSTGKHQIVHSLDFGSSGLGSYYLNGGGMPCRAQSVYLLLGASFRDYIWS